MLYSFFLSFLRANTIQCNRCSRKTCKATPTSWVGCSKQPKALRQHRLWPPGDSLFHLPLIQTELRSSSGIYNPDRTWDLPEKAKRVHPQVGFPVWYKGAALLPEIPTASPFHPITSLIFTHSYKVSRGNLNPTLVSYHSPSHHWSTGAETEAQNEWKSWSLSQWDLFIYSMSNEWPPSVRHGSSPRPTEIKI